MVQVVEVTKPKVAVKPPTPELSFTQLVETILIIGEIRDRVFEVSERVKRALERRRNSTELATASNRLAADVESINASLQQLTQVVDKKYPVRTQVRPAPEPEPAASTQPASEPVVVPTPAPAPAPVPTPTAVPPAVAGPVVIEIPRPSITTAQAKQGLSKLGRGVVEGLTFGLVRKK